MKQYLLYALLLFYIPVSLKGQSRLILETIDSSQQNVSFRGLTVVSEKILWVSGSKGTVGRSLDGGSHWQWQTIHGFEKRDFRDIHGFNENEAVIMAVAEPAQILRTSDGGAHWTVVFTDTTQGMFLDAMDFSNKQNGVVIGDPIKGEAFIALTKDGGKTWIPFHPQPAVLLDQGEAFFAASGSNIHLSENGVAGFVTGGKQTRFWSIPTNQSKFSHSNMAFVRTLPLQVGKESTGANSLFHDGNLLWVCGGDFGNDKESAGTWTYSKDGGESWTTPPTSPKGYKSCIIKTIHGKLIACGTTGVELFDNQNNKWEKISETGFHVCQSDPKGRFVFLAGGKGRIAKISLRLQR